MKNVLAERHIFQEDSQKSDGQSPQSFVEPKAGEADEKVQWEKSHSPSSTWESSSSQASPNKSRGNQEGREENLPQPPQYEIAQKAFLPSGSEYFPRRPNLGTTQLRQNRRQKERVKHWPYHQWANRDQGTAIAQGSQYQTVHPHESNATSLSFLGRVGQWAKFSVLLLGSMSVAAIVLKYPLPSSERPQPSVTTKPFSPNPTPTLVTPSPLPQELPPSVTPEAKLPPLQEVPLPTSATPSALPENQHQTLSVSPAPEQIPSPTSTAKLSSPDPSGSVPLVPPPLPSIPPLTPPPCPCEVATQVATPPGKADKNTRLNNNTQVAEVRNYLQQRWNPPSGLTQTLEYSLLLGRDGSIERIIPLGNAAVEYIDRTNIPLPGKPFVSSLQGEANSKIRVALTPNGKVQTSLEN
jgi:hypothetical protein